MENIDERSQRDVSDENLLMSQLFGDDAELLYLDVFLTETFRREHVEG